ncbi:hypothetical protein FFWV33_14155 [Flavobacterium faecale]|uniref:Uncharacterized protein n=1 Tax=Flavobacterium faecale TaxID=1355330 RepID=A0A2S1LGB8_9FLAO|nr:hypothetical protein [Flavobacterium faecale]AWG22586.1 hypothetical protein FFWV33_14155 [Flavobacterium faecale]
MEDTSLVDIENNLKFFSDNNNNNNAKIVDEIKNSINFRIQKHREFIKKSKAVIIDNIDYLSIVESETNKIIARKNKIIELRELAEYSFGIKLI